MGFGTENLRVEQVDESTWRLGADLVYRGARETFTVPEGFLTDFASVPRAFVWLLPRYGSYTKSAVLHDYLCRSDEVDRSDADGLFRRSMRELDVSAPRRWMMWAAVRAASFMRRADLRQWLQFLLVAPLAIAFVAIPAITVQVFLLAFWLVELVIWSFQRALGRTASDPPRLQVRAT